MRSNVHDILPVRLRRGLAKLGTDIAIARKKRGVTVAMMAERVAVGKSTYLRVEKGDPTVALGIYAMALFSLGFPDALSTLLDPARDEQGLLLDVDRLPKRVRRRREAVAE